jgi:phosphate-selective porin OprO and OprP
MLQPAYLFANASEYDDLLEVLRENETITEEQYQILNGNREPPLDVKPEDGVILKSAGDNLEIELGGRLLLDAAIFNDDQTDLGDGTNIDSARISLSVDFRRNWKIELEFDFAEEDFEVKDAWVKYSFFDELSLKLGNFREPFSLEEVTGSRYITFMERALPNLFAPGRHLGVGLNGFNDHWTFGAGIFGEEVDPGGKADEDDEGFGFSGRLTFAPLNTKENVVHLGVSGSYRTPNHDDDDEVSLNETPESDVTNRELVDTGDIVSVESTASFGAEAAGVFGPFSIQGEYIVMDLNREDGFKDVEFDGGYIFASWFLTGEHRNYKRKKGAFGSVKPKAGLGEGGVGAWELAVRYSTIDLDDHALNVGIIDNGGGKEDNITLGINWYLNPAARFMFNYITVDSHRQGVDDNPEILQFRAQFHF